MSTILKWLTPILETRDQFQMRLVTALNILRSFLPWRQKQQRSRAKGALPITVHRQWTSYSCTAAVAQMVASYYGITLSHRKAIQITKCRPNGATMDAVARALKREFGLRHKTLIRASQVRAAIRRGEPVLTNDAFTYASDHAILAIGETPKGFHIADPATAQIYWKHERVFIAGANEFIAVSSANPSTPRVAKKRTAQSVVFEPF